MLEKKQTKAPKGEKAVRSLVRSLEMKKKRIWKNNRFVRMSSRHMRATAAHAKGDSGGFPRVALHGNVASRNGGWGW